jgi:hypothetical protein
MKISASSSSSAPASDEQKRQRRMLLGSIQNVAGANIGRTSSIKIWTDLPERLKVDKEFALAALRFLPFLPDKNHFERKFPQSLRFDRDVVLAFCNRPDFPTLYEQRHLYPPPCLTGDKSVMLAYCRKIPRSLQECSEELADDREVVEAAVALDGLELQYASPRLQEDPGVVRAACRRDGRALEFVPPGSLKASLCGDREFMIDAIRQQGGSVWRLASEPLRTDRELLLEALANGMRMRFCPPPFREDAGFLCEALDRKSLLYLELPRTFQSQEAVARAAVVSPTSLPEVHTRALELVPRLGSSRDVVLAVAQRGNPDVLSNMFLAEGNDIFRDDKEIVLAALAKQPSLFSRVSPRLRSDNDVLVAAMDENSALDIIKMISPTVQQENPEIPAHAIKVCSDRNLRYLRSHIRPASLWGTKIVALAWVRRGLYCLPPFDSFMNDPEFALAVAEHVPVDFIRVHASLRGDESFLRQALALNGRVLRYAEPPLQRNYSLLTLAIATTPDALWPGAPVTKEQVVNHLEEKLQLHRVFVGDFLRGIAIHSSVGRQRAAPSKRSALPLLDRGVETSQAFKRLIAEFLGIPLGRELERVRRAHANLINPPPAPPPAAAADAGPLPREAVWNDPLDDLADLWRLPMMRGPVRHADRGRRMFGVVGEGDGDDEDEAHFMMMLARDDPHDDNNDGNVPLFRRRPSRLRAAGMAAVPPAAAAADAPANNNIIAGAQAAGGRAARFMARIEDPERQRRRHHDLFAIRMEFRRAAARGVGEERPGLRMGLFRRPAVPRPVDGPVAAAGSRQGEARTEGGPPAAAAAPEEAFRPVVQARDVTANADDAMAVDRDENRRMIERMLLEDDGREEVFPAVMDDEGDFFDAF